MAHRAFAAAAEKSLSVRPFFAHAVAATAMVVLTPLWVVILLLTVVSPALPMAAVAAAAVISALGTIVGGTSLWMRSGDAAFISFSDLMLPRYLARRRAELQVTEGTRLLGLDASGRPVGELRVTPQEQLQVLKHLTAALEAKDPYTHGHSQRVERHAYRTAAALGLSAEQLEDIRKTAALHDVGKIRVPDRILRKDGRLTEDERRTMEDHAIVGAWMVSSVGNPDVIAGVKHHHEHWDGSGYPDGLAGTEIPLFARVIAVADTYDALNSTRPYRASCGRPQAIEILEREAGRQLDPVVVASFLSSLPTRLPVATGLLVAFAGPTRLLRDLISWLKRFGAGSLAPALGAAGAVAVLGASVFSPGLPAGPTPSKTTAVAALENALGGIAVRDVAGDRPQAGEDSTDDLVLGRRLASDRVVGSTPTKTFSGAGAGSSPDTTGGGSPVGRGGSNDSDPAGAPGAEPGGTESGGSGSEEEGAEPAAEPEEGRDEEEDEEEPEDEYEASGDEDGSGSSGSHQASRSGSHSGGSHQPSRSGSGSGGD